MLLRQSQEENYIYGSVRIKNNPFGWTPLPQSPLHQGPLQGRGAVLCTADDSIVFSGSTSCALNPWTAFETMHT